MIIGGNVCGGGSLYFSTNFGNNFIIALAFPVGVSGVQNAGISTAFLYFASKLWRKCRERFFSA